MSSFEHGAGSGTRVLRARAIFVALAALAALWIALPSSASAERINKEDFLRFINCPVEKSNECTYGETLAGEFKMGSKTVPITNPVILQGGMENFSLLSKEPLPLVAPRFGAEALSRTSQPIPGGLTGISELVGGPASATAELAGPVSGITVTPYSLASTNGIGVVLPIKVHLENEDLGPECYIGSDAEPIVLHLTDGTTEPPSGTTPISGKEGVTEGHDKDIIEFRNNTLVDNTFAVPGAKNCGPNPALYSVITPVVNLAAGLPAEAGKNSAELTGNLFVTPSVDVVKYIKKAIKAKEKEVAGTKKRKGATT